MRSGIGRTTDGQAIPELPLRLSSLLQSAALPRRVASGRKGRGRGDLARMDATLTMQAGHALAVLLRQCSVGDAGGACQVAGGALGTLGGALGLLNLVRDLLRVEDGDYVCRGRGQQGEDGKGTILLVLLESAPQASRDTVRRAAFRGPRTGKSSLFLGDAVAAHAFTGIVNLAEDILGDDVGGADDTYANGNRGPVVAQPAPGRGEHVGRRR